MENKIPYRKLRGYAFDPSLSLQLDTLDFNSIVYTVPWERLAKDSKTGKSFPSGEYLEIIDYDPASGVFYPPIDMDDDNLLLQNGHSPDVNNPQFHQQMVYAVAMTTIKNFEHALGRKIQWSGRTSRDENGYIDSEYVPQLRIYPHALTQANAYYSSEKKALLFGYFETLGSTTQFGIPSLTIFTVLSHDIIAHEITHALLDGLHKRYIEPTNPDTRAFHEGISDLVALFQHFTFPEVLKHQIAKTRGNLESQNLLGQLAQEFGKAIGNYGSLRDAIGYYDKKKETWVLDEGNPKDYQNKMEFHDRGSILVATVFSAFLNIYKRRSRPILRIASGGSGILPDGELHPDLVNELSRIAAKTAGHVLKMCIRALDYCPPVDVTFGDFLRALITADYDLVTNDQYDYRIAFIEAFQKRGIFPKGLKNISVESLCYQVNPKLGMNEELKNIFIEFLRDFKNKIAYETDRKKIHDITQSYIAGSKSNHTGLHKRITESFIHNNEGEKFEKLTGLLFPLLKEECENMGLAYSPYSSSAKFQIGNLWLSSRTTPDGRIVNHVIITISQRRGIRGNIKDNKFNKTGCFTPFDDIPEDGIIFRGGCTLIFDLDTLKLKYAIKKSIDDNGRIEQQFRYTKYNEVLQSSSSMYFDNKVLENMGGPFAFMHNH